MLARPLLVTGFLSFTLSAVLAQSRPEPAYFLRHPTGEQPHFTPPLLTGLSDAPPTAAPVPTVRVATAMPTATGQRAVADAASRIVRYYLAGTPPTPPYDLYQNWPEAQRKAMLPTPSAEPLPMQLLRGVLGR